MGLKECYLDIGGNYEDVVGRLYSEKLVRKFVMKFLNDPSYELLESSLKAEIYDEAFGASHTLKGICQNLSFTRLQQSSSALTEALRSGFSPEVPELMQKVTADYQQTAAAIRKLQVEEGAN